MYISVVLVRKSSHKFYYTEKSFHHSFRILVSSIGESHVVKQPFLVIQMIVRPQQYRHRCRPCVHTLSEDEVLLHGSECFVKHCPHCAKEGRIRITFRNGNNVVSMATRVVDPKSCSGFTQFNYLWFPYSFLATPSWILCWVNVKTKASILDARKNKLQKMWTLYWFMQKCLRKGHHDIYWFN